jgi:hypothetical protein
MLTGTHDDMKRIEADCKLSDWYAENLDWLRKTFGDDSIVSAVLHLNEKTPHIHATVVPFVTGERRKAKQEHKTETYEKVRDLYDRKGEARDRFLDMDRQLQEKRQELNAVETRLRTARQEYEPYKAQDELGLIHSLFPMMKENLRLKTSS